MVIDVSFPCLCAVCLTVCAVAWINSKKNQ